MTEHIKMDATIPAEMSGKRLDQILALMLPEHSRARMQAWIRDGRIKVNMKPLRPCDRMRGGERLEIDVEIERRAEMVAEAMPLSIIYEDESLLVVDKPAGLITHPGAGVRQHTLMNGLLHHDPELGRLARAGIVHRLDKDTSGLLVVARTPQMHTCLVRQMHSRQIRRQYVTLVTGGLIGGGVVDQPVGRHPRYRTRMAVVNNGRPAKTHYRIAKKYPYHTRLRITLETGRTHQIRVHMAWLGHPIVGDPVYSAGQQLLKGMSPELIRLIRDFPRQALHAHTIELKDPRDGRIRHWQAPLPADINGLIGALERQAGAPCRE